MPRSGGDHELAAGELAYTEVDAAHSDFPEILGAYDALARWAKENGCEFAGPARST